MRPSAARMKPVPTLASPASMRTIAGLEASMISRAVRGCAGCGGSGYKGRIGLFEAVRVDETVRRLVNAGGDEAAIAGHAFRGAPTLAGAARSLVLDGTTSAEEAIRVSRHESVDA